MANSNHNFDHHQHDHRQEHHRRSAIHHDHPRNPRPGSERRRDLSNDHRSQDNSSMGTPLDEILNICRLPPKANIMDKVNKKDNAFLILPFKYEPSIHNSAPSAINSGRGYIDQWDANHVHMPCSTKLTDKNKKSKWMKTVKLLNDLKSKCDAKRANITDLTTTIEECAEHRYNLDCLQTLITTIYSSSERAHFLSDVLSNICQLAMTVDTICSRPPPLLRTGKGQSVTMSQKQAASLLACAFFCLFPYRSEHDRIKDFENFQNPNFNRLYQRGPREKIEKLKCILHYFNRITKKMPTGVISIRRYVLPKTEEPDWSHSKAPLTKIHITADAKIEDISCVLQVDFANKYIGGGVLGNGCVQEEIRFSICPEMLVSLLVCEMMESNECIFLVGCERYCSYEGYGGTFKFADDYVDKTYKDNWGRKWCHLVAIDALFFRNPNDQYNKKDVIRELIKAYTGFRPRPSFIGAENLFGIASGHWGCGAFNGDKQLKAIIQLMAASEAQRPLVYAAFHDRKFSISFYAVHQFLMDQKATVADLYHYIMEYCRQDAHEQLFDFILHNPIDLSKL